MNLNKLENSKLNVKFSKNKAMAVCIIGVIVCIFAFFCLFYEMTMGYSFFNQPEPQMNIGKFHPPPPAIYASPNGRTREEFESYQRILGRAGYDTRVIPGGRVKPDPIPVYIEK